METAVKAKVKRRHLNAEALEQSAHGTNALTQPHAANPRQGSRDPNRGLYPRTPTKRPRCGNQPSGSPALKQTGIGSFFSVTGVLRTSPQKSAQPCSSTHTLNGDSFSDDDDWDDVSLLAAEAGPEEEEEEELDDASLLAAEGPPERHEEKMVDHLEGITSEMFGDDFDQCDAEEEVEALPDAHYGLLGPQKVLLQPQGCMDDLPEEVLRQVLSLVPARDLYTSVSRVCHQWRDIVQDAKFVPFKKQYYRYMMREKETVLDIQSILKNNSITASSEHSIRHLVTLMAQHKVGERLRPEDVLERVKKHRLFPQAEASVRLCIPDIRKSFNLGLEGPNPYAAMAVILILSESVGDVQALVSLLAGCMSDAAVTDFLCHMATMLLAAERSSIKISNRLHYNIHYVLHLRDNGPFPDGSGTDGRPQMMLTGEQQQILRHEIQREHLVKIVAFAGTGKTTTLVKYAEQRPSLRFLYVAFNKSVASEAQRRFPGNVDCKTVHSLAYKDVGKRYQNKLTFNLKPFSLASVLPKGRGGFTKAKVLTTTLNTFMASTDEEIDLSHVPEFRMTKEKEREIIKREERLLCVQDARMVWKKMVDLKGTKANAFYMTHDGYLKLWQLQTPRPRLSDKYDVLFIDEAQDCTPAIMDVMLSQRCGKILVGDPHQQIYTFKGAVNSLNRVAHTHIFYLTQSFRFGAEVAYVGATILKVCKDVEKLLVGGRQQGGVCDERADEAHEAARAGISPSRGTTAILSRCNLTVFCEAVRLIDANPRCRIHFVGGINGIGLSRILDIWQLLEGKESIKDPMIRSFAKNKDNGFFALKCYTNQTEDLELEGKIKVVEKYGSRIPELVKRLEECFEYNSHSADFILGTVHKAKGLEFDVVMITDDFANLPCSAHTLHFCHEFEFFKIPSDEWNLLYVAATRAKKSLIITMAIRRILTMAREYFLKSEMPGTLVKTGDPLPCCVPACPNCTTPGSAFIMCKRQMKLTEGVSAGGPLCERCVWTRVGPTAFLMNDEVLSMAEIPRRLDRQLHHMMLGLF